MTEKIINIQPRVRPEDYTDLGVIWQALDYDSSKPGIITDNPVEGSRLYNTYLSTRDLKAEKRKRSADIRALFSWLESHQTKEPLLVSKLAKHMVALTNYSGPELAVESSLIAVFNNSGLPENNRAEAFNHVLLVATINSWDAAILSDDEYLALSRWAGWSLAEV